MRGLNFAARASDVESMRKLLLTGLLTLVALPAAAAARPITHRQWLSGVVLTEYYPSAEASCCTGARARCGNSGR